MAQRIVRAKRKLHDNHASYRIPRAAELPDRLHAVLAAIYLIYTEGHTATSGQSLTRTDLSTEAIRLGRTLVELMPDEPEAIGLLALMLLTESRRPARSNADGTMVRLADQDRSRWDPDTDHRRPRARARLPSPQPARTVPDPGSDSRGARRRPHRRSHRLVPDHRPLRPALRPAPPPCCCPEPIGGHRGAPRPCRGARRARRDRRRHARQATSHTTPPAPTFSHEQVAATRHSARTTEPSNSLRTRSNATSSCANGPPSE